jgi:hypothetical protein
MSESAESGANDSTRQAEEEEAKSPHVSDREPTAEEEEAASEYTSRRSEETDKSVAEHEQEMTERGVHQKGEGRIE